MVGFVDVIDIILMSIFYEKFLLHFMKFNKQYKIVLTFIKSRSN